MTEKEAQHNVGGSNQNGECCLAPDPVNKSVNPFGSLLVEKRSRKSWNQVGKEETVSGSFNILSMTFPFK